MRTSTLVGTALATASTAVIGSIASKRGVQTWYPKLDKPGYVPPNGVFPVAWTTLYADIAVTSASAIDRMRDDGDDARRRNYVAALGVNLVLNAGWSWLFFRLNKLGPSRSPLPRWPSAVPTWRDGPRRSIPVRDWRSARTRRGAPSRR